MIEALKRSAGRQLVLRPGDVAVALQLALTPDVGYQELTSRVLLSYGETYNSVQRLSAARLLRPDGRAVVKPVLLDFLLHGVPYSFPARIGPESRGIPTAHSAPALAAIVDASEPLVWPFIAGQTRGASVTPLYPHAPRTQSLNPPLYELLTLVDAIRIGRARERNYAEVALRDRLQVPASR